MDYILSLVVKFVHVVFVIGLTGATIFSNNRFVLYVCIFLESLLYLQWHIFGECLLTRLENVYKTESVNQDSFMIKTMSAVFGKTFTDNIFLFAPIFLIALALYKVERIFQSMGRCDNGMKL